MQISMYALYYKYTLNALFPTIAQILHRDNKAFSIFSKNILPYCLYKQKSTIIANFHNL